MGGEPGLKVIGVGISQDKEKWGTGARLDSMQRDRVGETTKRGRERQRDRLGEKRDDKSLISSSSVISSKVVTSSSVLVTVLRKANAQM